MRRGGGRGRGGRGGGGSRDSGARPHQYGAVGIKKKASAGPAPIFDNGAVVVGTAKPAAPAEGSASAYLRFSGSAQFRQRLVNSLLSKKRIRIDDIRSDSERPGLQDFEASFLRLLDKLTNGTALEINETGTALRFVPGVLQGGVIEHDCGLSRSVGWFIEGILPLLPFCKKAAAITLTGITSDAVDWGVDALRSVVLPFLSQFGLSGEGGFTLTLKARGCAPLGGGKVQLTCPVVRELSGISITEEGLVKKVRGVAYCARVSPHVANRLATSAKPLLLTLLPDVHVFTDAYKGTEAGGSPGYGITLFAHTTSGVTYCVQSCTGAAGQVTGTGGAEAAAALAAGTGLAVAGAVVGSADGPAAAAAGSGGALSLPEDLGAAASAHLLDEVARGGCIPTALQALAFTFMALTSEDVSRLRIGQLGPAGIATLRLLKAFFGVTFRLLPQAAGEGAPLGSVPIPAAAGAGAAAAAGVGSKRKRSAVPDLQAGGRPSRGGGKGDGADDAGGSDGELEDADNLRSTGRSSRRASEKAPVDAYTQQPISAEVAPSRSSASILVSVLGIGYKNTAKKVT